jgi:hypothetical protein
MTDYLLIFGALFLLIGFPILGYLSDRRYWNNGRCECGGQWIYFDSDSQGGLGHKCSHCKATLWTSWIRKKNTTSWRLDGALPVWNKQEINYATSN